MTLFKKRYLKSFHSVSFFFSQNIEGNTVIEKSKLTEVLSKVINTHVRNPNICQNCCTTLKYMLSENCKKKIIISQSNYPLLTFNSDNTQMETEKEEAIEAIVRAMRMNIENGRLCLFGCDALRLAAKRNSK